MIVLNSWIKMFGRSFLLTYIDAGTGSLIIQVLIGAAAGGLLAVKMYWNRIKKWTKRNHPEKGKLEEEQGRLIE